MDMQTTAMIGFGEAAQAFAGTMIGARIGYDRKTDSAGTRADKLADGVRLGITLAESNARATAAADLILSLVTADQALAAAEETARSILPGSIYFDMNSVAPDTKRAAALAIANGGGRYVDVAVMAPVHPARLAVPLLVGGPSAQDGAAMLQRIGFANVRVVGDEIGAASAIKMIRSVMVKGIEALTAECLLAADLAGVREEVIASLDASRTGADWDRRGDYNLDRMLAHGLRRAAEMDEVVKTIEALGMTATMSRSTVARQREIGGFGLPSPVGLDRKLEQLRPLLSHHDEGRRRA